MPEPNTPAYTQAVVAAALPALEASAGRAFMLFTSLRAMREGYERLKEAFAQRGLGFPLMMQGEGSRTELLERFRRLGNAVLVGSQSFWEGVDVRGEALSLVMIDKLPFAPPDDPVLAARIEKINRDGGNAFVEYQLPQAVITLKQGAGRLIRDETDRGVLMICDPRLFSKGYGRRILAQPAADEGHAQGRRRDCVFRVRRGFFARARRRRMTASGAGASRTRRRTSSAHCRSISRPDRRTPSTGT